MFAGPEAGLLTKHRELALAVPGRRLLGRAAAEGLLQVTQDTLHRRGLTQALDRVAPERAGVRTEETEIGGRGRRAMKGLEVSSRSALSSSNEAFGQTT